MLEIGKLNSHLIMVLLQLLEILVFLSVFCFLVRKIFLSLVKSLFCQSKVLLKLGQFLHLTLIIVPFLHLYSFKLMLKIEMVLLALIFLSLNLNCELLNLLLLLFDKPLVPIFRQLVIMMQLSYLSLQLSVHHLQFNSFTVLLLPS